METIINHMKDHSLLNEHIGYWLRLVSNHVSASFAKRLSSEGMGVGEWVILNLLTDQRIMSPAEIAESIGITRGAATKLIDRLCHSDLITRKESSVDRRFQEISLTKKGVALLPTLHQHAEENENDFFVHLSENEKEHLLNILKKIALLKRWTNKPIN